LLVNLKIYGTPQLPTGKFRLCPVIITLTYLHRILAEYYIEDQDKYPKAGTASVSVNFVPTPSDSAIVRTAGQLMSS
jgi:hypothetical protein